MAHFYTNVQCFGNSILYRGVKDGKRIKQRIDYSPSLYVPSRKSNQTEYKSLEGIPLDRKEFEDLRSARDFVKQFEGLPGAPKIYGNTRYEYAYIADQHSGMVDWDQDHVSIAIVDIEVGSENGFPDPYEANEPITAITITYLNGHTYVYGCGDYRNDDPQNITYYKIGRAHV